MRLLMIVQQIDESHWLRGFIVRWVRALAERVERLDVITLEWNKADLPDNVFVQSMGKEHGYTRLQKLWAFHRAINRVIREVDVVFSHMTPRYTLVAAPYAALHRKPQFLWYTHRHASLELRAALALTSRVVTAAPDTFPLPNHKVIPLGHGIDTTLFEPAVRIDTVPATVPANVVLLGRLSPIKHHLTMIEAAALLETQYGITDITFTIVGNEPPESAGYRATLEAEINARGLQDRFRLVDAVSYDAVPPIYRQATVALNLAPPGLFDKAALEAMLCGTPTIVANPAFNDLLGPHADALRIGAPGDAEGLAARLASLLQAAPETREQIGADLHAATREAHGLDQLMDRLVHLFEGG